MKIFLTASWKNLVFINYEINPALLVPYLPKGTEPDFYNGKCFASLVGFMFLNTKVRGISFPFHRNFEEFNLRFYVRRKEGNTYKRGVVFVKEIVPRRMITYIAYMLYGEQYYYYPMRNSLKENNTNIEVTYSFLVNKEWNYIQVAAANDSRPLITGTEEEFITEHYWGYTKMANGSTSEYQVQHPRWNIYNINSYDMHINTEYLYGEKWHECFTQKPSSIFMADGSPVSVFTRNILNDYL